MTWNSKPVAIARVFFLKHPGWYGQHPSFIEEVANVGEIN
jgi:hypothetical protein